MEINVQEIIRNKLLELMNLMDMERRGYVSSSEGAYLFGCSKSTFLKVAKDNNFREEGRKGHRVYNLGKIMKFSLEKRKHIKKI